MRLCAVAALAIFMPISAYAGDSSHIVYFHLECVAPDGHVVQNTVDATLMGSPWSFALTKQHGYAAPVPGGGIKAAEAVAGLTGTLTATSERNRFHVVGQAGCTEFTPGTVPGRAPKVLGFAPRPVDLRLASGIASEIRGAGYRLSIAVTEPVAAAGGRLTVPPRFTGD